MRRASASRRAQVSNRCVVHRRNKHMLDPKIVAAKKSEYAMCSCRCEHVTTRYRPLAAERRQSCSSATYAEWRGRNAATSTIRDPFSMPSAACSPFGAAAGQHGAAPAAGGGGSASSRRLAVANEILATNLPGSPEIGAMQNRPPMSARRSSDRRMSDHVGAGDILTWSTSRDQSAVPRTPRTPRTAPTPPSASCHSDVRARSGSQSSLRAFRKPAPLGTAGDAAGTKSEYVNREMNTFYSGSRRSACALLLNHGAMPAVVYLY